MDRFILRYRGPVAHLAEELERIRDWPEVAIIDASSPYMLLVEAPEIELTALIDQMPDWVMAREQKVPLPNPRPKVRRGVKHAR